MNRFYRSGYIDARLTDAGYHPLDVAVTGCTGAGKSTTLNTLFEENIAEAGESVDPLTMEVDYYNFSNNIRLWDTPGLGDGTKSDKLHTEKIKQILRERYTMNGREYCRMDLVLVIINGSSKDLGTVYSFFNNVLLPSIQKGRILVAINQADMAKKGRHFDYNTRTPDEYLKQFLEEQAVSVQNRIYEASGVKIKKPVYYSARYNYNINKLFDMIIDNIPAKKRSIYVNRD